MKKTTINYLPKQGSLWDHWLYRAPDGVYHLYFLYDERPEPELNKPIWLVGHATSRDLVQWEEHAPVLRPDPERGVTDIATGSVIAFENRFAMLVTDQAKGICLAFSDDLYHWDWYTQNPVLPVYGEEYETREQMNANPDGCACWCDPYLFRVPGEESVYTLINTRLRDGKMEDRGCIALAKSDDLIHWKMLPPILFPGYCKRCETPQILNRNGRWYLLLSCFPHLLSKEFQTSLCKEQLNTSALVYTSEQFDGGYTLAGEWALFENESCYICKIQEGTDGKDCVLTIKNNATTYPPRHGETGITLPYAVSYPDSGGIHIE